MRKFVGGLLLLSGLIGLTLMLIFWLPTGMSLAIVVSVGLICLGCVWGGGKLLQRSVVQGEVKAGSFVAWQPQQEHCAGICPRCGRGIGSGQRFCGICGLPRGQVCLQCGSVVIPGFRFCTNCGKRLPEE